MRYYNKLFEVRIDLVPQSKVRAADAQDETGKRIRVTPIKLRQYENDVAQLCKTAYILQGHKWPNEKKETYLLECEFIFDRPRKMISPAGRVLHNTVPDVTNLLKAVEDAMKKGCVILDDRLIARAGGEKFYAAIGERAHVKATLYEYTIDPDEQSKGK